MERKRHIAIRGVNSKRTEEPREPVLAIVQRWASGPPDRFIADYAAAQMPAYRGVCRN
jgi:hypothetical protein